MNAKGEKRRGGDGGTYLVIADDTPEFRVALHYAVRKARARRGHLAMARIIEPVAFTEWMGVESAARAEARAKAEGEMEALAGSVAAEHGITPSLILREGKRIDEIIAITNGNPGLVALVLGASTQKGTPGPLVSYFTAKGISQLRVPVIIVPGHLKPEDLGRLV
ncbi:MAG: universal stress protein [Alphaproteobacteria bacterium]|nr:universal stress protein [Alphaproteobacteria bacterium]USO07478.1 MAG: universal stress protein [Rhodospirillales bacterium]